jgi:Ca2+-dependent lipid-binding protein
MFGTRKKPVDASRRLLYVEVVKAENILALAKTTSDPYLTIALADIGGREIKTESFKTKQKANTLAPQWNEKFVFGNDLTCKF